MLRLEHFQEYSRRAALGTELQPRSPLEKRKMLPLSGADGADARRQN